MFLSLHPSPLFPHTVRFRAFTSTKSLVGAFPSHVDAFVLTHTGVERLSARSENLERKKDTRDTRHWIV